MAVRAYWKGSLKLSLVSCPVPLYPATTTTDKIRFHMINKETGNRRRGRGRRASTGRSSSSLRGAQRRSNPFFLAALDRFTEPVIGRAFARPVGSQ